MQHATKRGDPLYNEESAGKYVGGESNPIAPETLRSWRKKNWGPAWIKLGSGTSARVRYRQSALDAFLAECEHHPSANGEVAR